MGNDVKIRLAANDDLSQIARIWHKSASQMDGAALPIPSIPQLRERIDFELAGGWKLFVAEDGGAVVGILAIKPEDAILDQIFVDPDDQRRGIGSILLGKAQEDMPNGFRLRMARANRRAAAFYERQGLKRDGEGVHPKTSESVIFYRWNGS